MTRFKRFIKDYRLKDFELKDFVYLALLTFLLVVFSLGAVGAFISMNILGFMSGNGAAISIVIVFDVICLLLSLVGIDNWLNERDRKKRGLSKQDYYNTEVKVIELSRLFYQRPPR